MSDMRNLWGDVGKCLKTIYCGQGHLVTRNLARSMTWTLRSKQHFGGDGIGVAQAITPLI